MPPVPISILMSVFNREDTLEPCLQSILQQTFPHFELIVVDDGSTDQTRSILEDYQAQDHRLKVLYERHSGLVPALNKGLSVCQGYWIARMDGDDWMMPNRLQVQHDFVTQNPHLELVGSLVEGVPQTSDYEKWANTLVTETLLEENIYVDAVLHQPTFFGKASVFQKLGGYQENGWAEDFDFLLRAHGAGVRLGKVNRVLLKKKSHGEQLTQVDWRYRRPAMVQAKVHYFLQHSKWNPDQQLVVVGDGPAGRSIAEAFFKAGVKDLIFWTRKPGTAERTVMGVPAYDITPGLSCEQKAKLKHSVIITAIGGNSGKQMFRQWMHDNDLVQVVAVYPFV